jgi:hypothetical protein
LGHDNDNDQPTPPEKNLFIIWILLVACILTYTIVAWCDRRRIQREAAEAAAAANAVTRAEHDTKEKIIKLNRDIYTQTFEILSNQCQLSNQHFKPIQAVDIENGKITLNAEAITTNTNTDFEPNDAIVLAFHKDPKQKNDDFCCTGTMCAICLDNYQEGETIVWSQDSECSHVYHKECFVDYLARRRNPALEDNPCPTCRRNFCKVIVS